MSIDNISNSVFPNTLSGLENLNVSNITINGVDVTTLFVPYSGANTNVDLNNKNLIGINGLTSTTVTATGLVQGGNVTSTGLTTTNTLKVNSVSTGTQLYTLAVDSAGNVIRATQIDLTALNPAVVANYFFSVFASNSAGLQTPYIDASSSGLKYIPFTQTFYCNNLNIASVPVGTGVYTLAVDSGGAVVRSTASSTATALTVYNSSVNGFIPIFDVNTGNATAYMGDSPSFTLSTLLYSFPGNITALQNITVGNVLTVNGTYISAPNLGSVPPSGVLSGYLAVDTGGAVYKATGVTAQPNITSGAPGSGIGYLTYAVAGSNQPIYVDSNASLQYNATYSSLALGASSIPFTSLLSPSAQFVIGSGGVQTQIALAGCIQGASTVIYTYSVSPQALLTVGQKVNVSGYTTNPSFNGTYLITSSTTTNFTITAIPYPPFTIGSGASASVQLIPINTGSLEFTSTSVLAPTPTPGDNSTKIATTAFVTTELSGYLTKTGTQTGINTILQLTASGNFTVQTSAGVSLLTIINALTTIGNEFKILNTSFPTFNISSSAIGTNRLTQFIETTAATTYAGTNTGDSVIIATNSLWNGVTAGYGQYFMNGTANVMNLTRVLLSGNQSILALGSASDATSIIRSDATTDMSIIAPIIYFRSGANITMSISSTLITHNLNSTFSLGSMVAPNALPNWYTANCVSVTFGSTSTSKGIGFGYNNTSGVSQICSVQPGTAYLPLEYWGSDHAFYASGYLVGTFSQSGGIPVLNFGTSGRGLSTITGASYGNVSTSGVGLGDWNGYDINKRYTFMSHYLNTNVCGVHDNTRGWVWYSNGTDMIIYPPIVIFAQLPQQNYLPNQVLIGNNGNQAQWGVLYSTFFSNGAISWAGGTQIASFYKASYQSTVRVSGGVSWYQTAVGMCYMIVRIYCTDTGVYYDLGQQWYSNTINSHAPKPICVQYGNFPTGNYVVQIYNTGNCITDANDGVFLITEIVPF